ncbi:MAG TPA: dihydrolipoamide acetyltransferase family protein [Acidimicrobiia bacterium]|nr:dihydrolipoamide acetyltransferase family protein [Acidimicrobiia bacterium]
MATTVSMPQLGETVTEGTILRWAKQVGDTIAEDEVLVEISTDKVDTEVPSPAAGTILEILVNEGDTVSVGTPMVVIGAEGEDAPASEEKPTESAAGEEPAEPAAGEEPAAEEGPAEPAADEETAEPAAEEKPAEPTPAKEEKPSEPEVEAFFAEPDETETKPNLLSPVVRKLIREHEVDVSQLSGTGDGGRITRKDVEAYLASGPSVAVETTPEAPPTPEPAPAPATGPQPTSAAAAAPQPAPVAAAAAGGQGTDEIELDRIRVRTAENMIKARQTAAHVWTSVEVDYERVERVRQAHKEGFKAAEGFSLTYLPFIARATIDALRAFPVVNSSFHLEEKKSVFHRNVDLGIAVDLDQSGLIVARVRNADGLRLVGIARSIRELADRARNGKLGVDDLTGSTFTITNPGPFGSFMSAPIINVPNVAILSTDTVAKRPTVVTDAEGQDMIAIRHIGYLGLTWDHRAFDGSTAVLFLQRIKQNLETWDWEQELA